MEGDLDALKGGGQPLRESTRAFFEPRLGCDLSGVRVHSDEQASELAHKVNARAFTLGSDIVFESRQYAPETSEGKGLLAHELTHVVQQAKSPGISNAIRRITWYPNVDTYRDEPATKEHPEYAGHVFAVRTGAGKWIDAWRPDDGKTYWCHGYTFGGSTAQGGPYSIRGQYVGQVLIEDGWSEAITGNMRPGNILVFYDADNRESHSGIVRKVVLEKLKAVRFCHDPILKLVVDNLLTLRDGVRSPDINRAVEKVQTALLELGFSLPVYGADGLFGKETAKAVREYQASRGLSDKQRDGKVGPITLKLLDSEFQQRGCVDENISMLESKWGFGGGLNTSSWRKNREKYGDYRCYA